jgi:CheY-like chemotaxis protein
LRVRVSTAANAQQAPTQLAAARPHVVLLDIVMPVVDSREVLRRLRPNRGRGRIAVLVLSAECSVK